MILLNIKVLRSAASLHSRYIARFCSLFHEHPRRYFSSAVICYFAVLFQTSKNVVNLVANLFFRKQI